MNTATVTVNQEGTTMYQINGFQIRTITAAEARAEQVRLWGEEKVAANEVDVARRFNRPRRR